MQNTSATWRGLFAAGAALQARATISGTVYTDIGVPVINRATMQDRLAVGNVVSASLSLALRSAGSVPRSAAVVIEVRLNDGQTASEWLPQGTFYISRRMRDPVTGLLALECYDALLKANALWTPSAGAWPRTLAAVTAELAALLGVALDSRTVIPTGAAYAMSQPDEGTTIRDALSLIGQAAGGNWIMTPAGKLRLVRLGEAGDTVDVAGVVGGIDVGPAGTVTGVRSTVDGVATLTGDDTGLVVDVTLPPVIAADMAEGLIGQAWQPFRLDGAIYDPAAELGDAVNAGANGEVASVLCSEQAAYGPAFRGDIAAPDPGEVTDEYPYIGSAERTLALAKAAIDRAVERYDDNLTQQEIFNRLTDNGAAQGLVLYNGQLYVNASYIQSGTLVLGGRNNQNGTLRVLNAAGQEIGTWTKDGIAINSGSLQLMSEAGTEKVKVSIKENYGEPFKVSYEGAYIDADTNLDGQMILLRDNNSGEKLYISPSEIRASESNAVWMYIAKSSSGIASLRLISDDGDIYLAPDRFYIVYNGDNMFEINYNNGNPVLYLTGDIDMGQAGASSGAPSVKWRTADGTVFSIRPYGNLFQIVRKVGDQTFQVLDIRSDGTIIVNPKDKWRSALGVVPGVVSLTAGADVSLTLDWQSNVVLSGVLLLNANVTVNTAITGSGKAVFNLPSGYKASVQSNPFLVGRVNGATHQLYIAANGTSIITGFAATNIPAGDYVLSGVILLG